MDWQPDDPAQPNGAQETGDAMLAVAIWGSVAFAAMLLAGGLALWKNRDYSSWMAWAFLVPPAVVVFLLLPRNTGPRPRQPSLDQLDRMA